MKWTALTAIVAVLCIIAGCGNSHKVVQHYTGDAAKNILLNRPWLDEYPQKAEQKFMAYVFSDEGIGVHDKAESAYRHHIEIFTFRATAEKLFFLFPHDKRKGESTYKVDKIQGGGPFNLKLTLTQDPQNGGKTYIYFSNTQWDITGQGNVPQAVKPMLKFLD